MYIRLQNHHIIRITHITVIINKSYNINKYKIIRINYSLHMNYFCAIFYILRITRTDILRVIHAQIILNVTPRDLPTYFTRRVIFTRVNINARHWMHQN